MGACKEIGQEVMLNANDEDDLMILLGIIAEIRPILAETNLILRSGVTIYAEDIRSYDILTEKLNEMGAIPCKLVSKKKREIQNNKMGIHQYQRYDRDSEIRGFLEVDEFLPIVLIHSLIPNSLEAAPNFLIYSRTENCEVCSIGCKIDIQKYLRKNSENITRAIDHYLTSEFYLTRRVSTGLFLTLGVAIEVWSDYYRNSHSEIDTKKKKKHLQEILIQCEELAETYRGRCDVCDAVKKSIEEYVDTSDVVIGRIDEIDRRMMIALRQEMAILYDEKDYFIYEKVLDAACHSMSQLVSKLNIKRELMYSGYLICNDLNERNFTVKKVVNAVDGSKSRIRVLRIKREFFERFDSPGLEERRELNACMSEVIVERLVESVYLP